MTAIDESATTPQALTLRVVIPERPERAAEVELAGEVADSGFVGGHWLVRRGERYLQLTELLYRILEQADGTRTIGEIADAVTRTSEWLVEPDDVRKLVAARLMPLGLIQTVDGETLRLPGRAAPEEARPDSPSPLAVNLRRRLLGPGSVDRLATPLRHLFAPVVLVPIVAVAAAAHLWLYTSHGLMAALIEALYVPGSLLILLVLIVAAAVFHELGHAAALRYSGGRARAMGVGVYLMFPVFYTDVTDSYRLGRWGRIRTGLGGIYFHLVFSVALIGVAFLLGFEFLLLGVLLINIEMVRQLIPFGRFDGYWVLADLTGIPDFYSQMPAFVRGALGRPTSGARLPELKQWPKVAFAVYTLATIPALALVAYFLFDRLPTFINVTWDAIGTQVQFLVDAVGRGDALVGGTAFGQLVVLGASAVAILYFLLLLVRTPMRAALRQRGMGRVVGLAATLAGVIFLATAWGPQMPLVANAAPAGVSEYDVNSRDHISGRVTYEQTPPVGGDHAPIVQNCGFYSRPVRNENAVHSLEHGAVWITYRTGLPPEEVEELRGLARKTYVLVSPFQGQADAIVATTWGRQLALGSALDRRLQRFVDAFRVDERAPEAGGPCSGGRGTPE